MQKSDHIIIPQVARRFREIRKERRITLEAATFDTGVNVARIEYSSKNLSLVTITKLCEYYEVTLEEFFKGLG